MSLFPHLVLESTVRVGDRTRFVASGSFVSTDETAIAALQIDPDNTGTYYDVVDMAKDSTKYIDWEYATAGTKTVVCKVITQDSTEETKNFTIEVLAAASDLHFCTDGDIVMIEPDIMKYTKLGRNSHLDVHREVTWKILNEIYKSKIIADDNTKLTIDEVLDYDEVIEWAKYYALEIIFESVSNVVDDIFSQKAKKYSEKRTQAMNLSMNVLKLDYDKSGTLTTSEMGDYRSSVVMKR